METNTTTQGETAMTNNNINQPTEIETLDIIEHHLRVCAMIETIQWHMDDDRTYTQRVLDALAQLTTTN